MCMSPAENADELNSAYPWVTALQVFKIHFFKICLFFKLSYMCALLSKNDGNDRSRVLSIKS